ncbi:CBS domain-containing protein [Candidatus Saccharibacteria bacterium]|nr:CBS domain-containing protein [Candidatus Saccharibacteria bacterium]
MRSVGIVLLVVIFLKCLLLYKTSKALSLTELRRRARSSDTKHTQALYKLLAFQSSLKIFILVIGTASGAVLLLLLANISGWLVVTFILATSWLLLDDRFIVRPGSWLWKVAGAIAPIELPVVDFLQPALVRITSSIGQPKIHSGVYEKEDLLELFDRQKSQIDNRLSETELKAARGALTFGDKIVSSVMTPRKAVEWVSQDNPIGPKLMDDLHTTGYTRFPVVAANSKLVNPETVGILYLRDLLKNLEKQGVVGDIMKRDAHFINESDGLVQALDGFLKSGQHLLIVVNNFEEVVGVLTLEDVLSQVLGEKISDEFDSYDDRHSVAGHTGK